ncbi:MAG: MBL fold metallo-hydrolase [Clostridia bacterium]|nr:MBL fold metallo-hydrolase [Clostridia bacterium]
MEILTFTTPYLSSHTYLLTENGHALIIDPCEMEEIKDVLQKEGLQLDRALLTHEHDDHITGVNWVRGTLHVPVLCSAACAHNIQDPRLNYSYYFELTKSAMQELVVDESVTLAPFSCEADESFEVETTIRWQGHTLLLHETPGHSRGCICILVDDAALFTGDTLLPVPTATRYKTGSRKDFNEIAVPYLRSLDPALTVYPGHYAPFNLGERLKSEP